MNDDWGLEHASAPMDVHHPPLEYELPRRLAALRDGTADERPNPQVAERRRDEIALLEREIAAARDTIADLDRIGLHLESAPVVHTLALNLVWETVRRRRLQCEQAIDSNERALRTMRARV